jgi:methylated-DNA-[protein]-cysteine S-methyltransferase
MTYAAILSAPFGALGVRIENDALAELAFLPPGTAPLDSSDPLIARLEHELNRYFASPSHVIPLPAFPAGSPFRQQVWRTLCQIPAGTSRTYGDVARQIGSAARAVGQAVGDNPWPILIPCHRVIAADGSLGGFMHSRTGFSQDIKRWLLQHEHALRG